MLALLPWIRQSEFRCRFLLQPQTRLKGTPLKYLHIMGMCLPMGSWFWDAWSRTGYLFKRRFQERGMTFWTQERLTYFKTPKIELFLERGIILNVNSFYNGVLISRPWLHNPTQNIPEKPMGKYHNDPQRRIQFSAKRQTQRALQIPEALEIFRWVRRNCKK